MSYIRKAITAAVMAAVAMAIKDWSGGLTPEEYGQIIGSAVAAGVAVYVSPANTSIPSE